MDFLCADQARRVFFVTKSQKLPVKWDILIHSHFYYRKERLP